MTAVREAFWRRQEDGNPVKAEKESEETSLKVHFNLIHLTRSWFIPAALNAFVVFSVRNIWLSPTVTPSKREVDIKQWVSVLLSVVLSRYFGLILQCKTESSFQFFSLVKAD